MKKLKIITEQEGTEGGRCGGQREDDDERGFAKRDLERVTRRPHKSPSYDQ